MRLFFAITFLLACFQMVNAQSLNQTIKGRIVDAQSEAPIVGVTVMILNTDPPLGAVTDLDGYYKISDAPVGRHSIQVRFLGYEDKNIGEVLVGSGKEVVVNTDLTESLQAMEEITIVADQQDKGQVLNEMATVSAISFSVEETSRYAATFDDPARAALSLPGVQGGGDDILNEIVIRGNSPRGLLWRIEGMEVFNPNHFGDDGSSGGGISMLSNNMMSRSDFYTGAFPAEYGNALSGVFDINLRKGNYDKNEFAFQAGLLGVQAAAEGPLKNGSKASYLINYRYSTLALFDKIGINILGESEEIVFQDLSFKFHFPTKKAGSFSLWGLGGRSENNIYPITDEGEYFGDRFNTGMGVYGLQHIIYLNQDTYLQTTFSQSASDYDYDNDSLGQLVYDREAFDNYASRLQLLLNKKINARNTLRVGVIGSRLGYNLFSEYNDRNQDRFITLVEDKGHTYFLQAYGQWQHRFNENITLNAGMHFSQLALNGNNAIEPRLGMRWKLDPTSTLNFGYGLHSRMESSTIYLAQDSTGHQPNKNLGLTRAQHIVAGYEKMVKPGVRFKAELYYQHLFNVPIWPQNPELPIQRTFSILNESSGYTTYPLVNDGTGDNYGLELSLERFMNQGFYYMVTTSLYEAKYVPRDGQTYDSRFNGNFIVNALGGKEFRVGRSGNNLFSINGRMIWSGGNRTEPINLEKSREQGYTYYERGVGFAAKLPNYWRLDVGVSYRKNKPNFASIISINVQNVTGKVNAYDHYYNRFTDQIDFEEQLGMFPNLSYRIEF